MVESTVVVALPPVTVLSTEPVAMSAVGEPDEYASFFGIASDAPAGEFVSALTVLPRRTEVTSRLSTVVAAVCECAKL